MTKSIKKQRKEVFKEIFDTHFHALCGFANKYLSDRDVAEDVVQEVFIGFWEKGSEIDQPGAIKAYLYTAVRNKCLNYLKHRLVIQKNEEALIYELESDQFFTNHVIEEETFNQLYQEIKNLPESAQRIMLLALKGLKNAEIAEELGISENTVKTQKKISYSKLKINLGSTLSGLLLSI